MTTLREAAQRALEACEQRLPLKGQAAIIDELNNLRAALAQQAEPTGKQPLQVESVAAVAENATTQQCVVEAPPSDYRRGYWDGFNIGKREGRIEAEDAAKKVEPVEPVALIKALRAALAQQVEPQGCATEEDCTKQPWCRIRGECQRKQVKPDHETRAELAEQQVVQLAEERDHYRNLWQKAQQAEPLNLRDPAVQKRLATQWGYVPAAQAEPVEPVAWLAPDGSVRETPAAKSFGEWVWGPDDFKPLYTAPPQRLPLTEEEIDGLVIQHAGYGRDNFYAVVRAVERAHGIKE